MPEAIALPLISEPLKELVTVPPPPANPATIADVAAGVRLCHDVFHVHREFCQSLGEGKRSFLFQTEGRRMMRIW